jgi:hypothetical protein
MDMIDIKNVAMLLENKKKVEPYNTFYSYGVQYIALPSNDEMSQCENCAFANCHCMYTADIPCCNNGVYFKVVKSMQFSLFCNGVRIGDIKQVDIENSKVILTDKTEYTLLELYNNDYKILPTVKY